LFKSECTCKMLLIVTMDLVVIKRLVIKKKVFLVPVFEHLAFSVKSGVEVKLVKLNTHVILYIYDGFHYSCVMWPFL
jgi:hypothetical protein